MYVDFVKLKLGVAFLDGDLNVLCPNYWSPLYDMIKSRLIR